MEFLKERVYTAKDAEEVKIGSKVIVADAFEKETAAFYMEVERERARILRNLLRYFGGNK